MTTIILADRPTLFCDDAAPKPPSYGTPASTVSALVGCGQTRSVSRFVTGHDFTGCGKTHSDASVVTEHDFKIAEKLVPSRVL
jgi:hypothetical protein